jgi:hypothetical protein
MVEPRTLSQDARLEALEASMGHQDFKSLFSDDDWRSLQASVVLVCRDAASGWADDRGWEAIGRALAGLAEEYSRSHQGSDLARTVVATLAEGDLRNQLITNVRTTLAKGSETDLFALTERAGRLVDRFCLEQGYGFRATLVLISMMVADQATR